jgi:hypothetical protein
VRVDDHWSKSRSSISVALDLIAFLKAERFHDGSRKPHGKAVAPFRDARVNASEDIHQLTYIVADQCEPRDGMRETPLIASYPEEPHHTGDFAKTAFKQRRHRRKRD